MHCHSFPPIARRDARVLILGTMPGKRSLEERQYYAHPQNAFWGIITDILGAGVGLPYGERVSLLTEHRVAVWDVLRSCSRASSLDADIEPATIVPNDFQRFFADHPDLAQVCFNGAKAAALFARHVRPHLPPTIAVEYHSLPSTSPANARVSRTEKRQAWQVITHDAQTDDHSA